MNSPSSRTFAKRATCPTTNDVVLYLSANLALEEGRQILGHLRSCDFCGAEAELLARHPVQAEVIVSPMIPQPLRLLAESLLASGVSGGFDVAVSCEMIALGRG